MEINDKTMKWAMNIVRQLSVLKNYGVTPEGWRAMATQLVSMVPSEEIGNQLITRILRQEEELPAPARIRYLLDYHFCRPADEEKK